MPYQFLAAFDAGEDYADRYRIVLESTEEPPEADPYWDRPRAAYVIGERGNVPNGVCMTTEYNMDGPYNEGEREIAYEALPEPVKKFIEGELTR